MTSSDVTSLRPGELEELGAHVGAMWGAGVTTEGSVRVAAVCAKFNGGITSRLLRGFLAGLDDHGIPGAEVSVAWVPGAFEVPLVVQRLARAGAVDAVVALGAVIRGDTPHFDFVAGQCAAGLRQVALQSGLPVVFGVLTTDTAEQALERSGEGVANKGYEAAVTALEMVDLLRQLDRGDS